jgi:hypothetical protein
MGEEIRSFTFLDEPVYKWAIGIGMILLFTAAWKTVIDQIKG